MQFEKNNLSNSLKFVEFRKTQSLTFNFEFVKQVLFLLTCSLLFGQIVLGQSKQLPADQEFPTHHSNKTYLKLNKDAMEGVEPPSTLEVEGTAKTLTPVDPVDIQTQCGRDNFEPNDNRYQAKQLPSVGVRRNARICSMGDVDVYKFQVDAAKPHVKLIFNTEAPINVDIHLEGGSYINFVHCPSGQVTELKANNLTPDTYYITTNGQHNSDWDATEGYTLKKVASSSPY